MLMRKRKNGKVDSLWAGGYVSKGKIDRTEIKNMQRHFRTGHLSGTKTRCMVNDLYMLRSYRFNKLRFNLRLTLLMVMLAALSLHVPESLSLHFSPNERMLWSSSNALLVKSETHAKELTVLIWNKLGMEFSVNIHCSYKILLHYFQTTFLITAVISISKYWGIPRSKHSFRGLNQWAVSIPWTVSETFTGICQWAYEYIWGVYKDRRKLISQRCSCLLPAPGRVETWSRLHRPIPSFWKWVPENPKRKLSLSLTNCWRTSWWVPYVLWAEICSSLNKNNGRNPWRSAGEKITSPKATRAPCWCCLIISSGSHWQIHAQSHGGDGLTEGWEGPSFEKTTEQESASLHIFVGIFHLTERHSDSEEFPRPSELPWMPLT